jgi:glycosyltransferase involved in cell wall biosynthesis
MRVLITHPFIRVGGAERIIFELAQHLEEKGVEVAIATLGIEPAGLPQSVGDFTYLRASKTVAESVRSYHLRSTIGLVNEAALLRKLVQNEGRRFTVLNPHNFPAMWACALDERPVVWMCNEPPYTWANPNPGLSVRIITRMGMPLDSLIVRRYATQIVSCSEWTRERVQTRYGRDSTILYPGVDCAFYGGGNSEETPAPFNPGDCYVLLQVGELIPKKNQIASVRAVSALVASGMADVVLYIIGKDTTPYGQEVRREIAARNLEDHVKLLGYRSDTEVRAAYREADVLLFPSHAESFGLAPLEALCAGTPCIVSPEAGVSKMIERIGGGIVTLDLPTAIRGMREKGDEVTRTIARARQYIHDRVSWDAYCSGMWRLLQNA